MKELILKVGNDLKKGFKSAQVLAKLFNENQLNEKITKKLKGNG